MAKNENKEYQMLDQSVREFAARQLAPHLPDNDRYPAGEFFDQALNKAMELDFFHVMLPEDLNGWGGRITPLGLILKAVAETDASLGAILLANAVAQDIIRLAGGGEILKEMVNGAQTPRELLLACPLLTNPDDEGIPLSAESRDGGYALSGRMDYVVPAPLVKKALVPARTVAGPGYDFFLVDLEQPGVTVEGPVLGMGLHACPAADLTFDRAKARLIGSPGQGPAVFNQAMTRTLPAAAAVSCGLMRGSLKEAVQYSRKRSQGGRRIIDWSELRLLLADMALKTRTAETLLDRAWQAADEEAAGWVEDAFTAAVYSLEQAGQVASDGIQALGGYGYTKDFFQERRFRDAQHLRCVFGNASLRRMSYVKQCLNW
ncbi:MAG: acyl-CoA dehydrogenase family protein [Thermodesulfobacteriota bacterium]